MPEYEKQQNDCVTVVLDTERILTIIRGTFQSHNVKKAAMRINKKLLNEISNLLNEYIESEIERRLKLVFKMDHLCEYCEHVLTPKKMENK